MYEISLVPDVKGEMIKQQKLRNLVFMICVIVAGACVGVILILVSIMGGQTIKLAAQDTEIECRSSGKTSNSSSCDSKFGTAVMNFKNVTELLTFQEQMKKLLELIRKMKSGEGNYPDGITSKRQKALWNNRKDWMIDGESEENAQKAVVAADEAAEYDANRDWRDSSSKDAFLFQDRLKELFPDRTDEQIYNLYKYLAQNS